MDETRRLCEFVGDLTFETIPGDLIDLAKLYTLDFLGAAIYGSEKEWSRIVAVHGKNIGSTPLCTVFAADWKASPEIASLVNGSMGHAFELDDWHELLHPSTVVVPAALAVAEANQYSGKALLLGVIAGYEVVCRIGQAGGNSALLRGFHTTGTVGTFGAAAAVGKLLKHDKYQLVHAMGIAGSLGSGIMEFSQTGGMVKRLHAGRAAEGGVLSAYLARAGFTGPTTVLEGKYGFCHAFSDAPEMRYLTDGLGRNYALREIAVKPYACCSDLHPTIDALLKMKEKHTIDPALVEHVLVEGATKLVEQNALNNANSIMAAQYSIPFSAAATLLHDIRDPRIYRDDILSSPAVRTLSSKVELRKDNEFDSLYPLTIASRVTVRLRDGQQLSESVYNAKGSPKNPMSPTEIEEKFFRLTAGILPTGRSQKIRDLVMKLERVSNVVELTSLLGK